MKNVSRSLFLKNSQGVQRYVEQFQRASLSSKLVLIGLSTAVLLSLLFAIARSTQAPDRTPVPSPAAPSAVEQGASQSQSAAPTSDQSSSALQAAVTERLEQWRSAWEQRNAEMHLSFFHPSFNNLKAYSENRRKRMSEVNSIEVKISELQFKPVSGTELAVVFIQSYKSERFSDRVRKEMVWKDTGNGPLIVSERVLP